MVSARIWHRVLIPMMIAIAVNGYGAGIAYTYLVGGRTVAHGVTCSGGRQDHCAGMVHRPGHEAEMEDISGMDFHDLKGFHNGDDVPVCLGPIGAYVDTSGMFVRRFVTVVVLDVVLMIYVFLVSLQPDSRETGRGGREPRWVG